METALPAVPTTPDFDGNMQFITVASGTARGFHDMQRTAQRYGVPVTVLGVGEPFHNFMSKVHGVYPHLLQQDPDEIVVFHDAYDVVFTRSAADIAAAVTQFALGERVLFSAERNCYPDSYLVDQYDTCSSPYRFLNAGCYAGSVRAVLKMIDDSHALEFPLDENDQRVFTHWHLKNKSRIVLDTHCTVFQTLGYAEGDFEWEAGRIRNRSTGSYPAIFHGNGYRDLAQILSWIDAS